MYIIKLHDNKSIYETTLATHQLVLSLRLTVSPCGNIKVKKNTATHHVSTSKGHILIVCETDWACLHQIRIKERSQVLGYNISM